MATGDFQQFRPSDSAFQNPGELTESWRTMALERATESSNLERLYRTLEQEQSQFEASLGEKRYEFVTALGEKGREFNLEYGENVRQFDEQLDYLYAKYLADNEVQNRRTDIMQSEEDRASTIDWIKTGAGVLGVGKDLFEWGSDNNWWDWFEDDAGSSALDTFFDF